METKIYDKETGTTIYMEGTFANLTARIEDEDGDTVFEFKNGHLSEFNQIVQNLGNTNNQYEESKTESETDGNGSVYRIKEEQDIIEKGTLCVVNTNDPDYFLKYDKGTIIKFVEFDDDYLPYCFTDSKGAIQYMDRKDFDILEEQRGTKKRFEFAKSSKILLTEDTDFAGTKVKLIEKSPFIKDDGYLFIGVDDKDGVPLIRRERDAKRCCEDIDKFIRKENSTEKIEVGDAVKVKEGKERRGAKGIAVVSDIVGEDVYLKGYDKFGKYDEEWINNIKNVTKEF